MGAKAIKLGSWDKHHGDSNPRSMRKLLLTVFCNLVPVVLEARLLYLITVDTTSICKESTISTPESGFCSEYLVGCAEQFFNL